MPSMEIQSKPKSQRVRADFTTRLEIKEAFGRIVGPAIPEGQYIQVDLSARAGTDIILVQYFAHDLIPTQTRDLIRDAALVAKIADFEWSESPMFVKIRPREQSAHEAIELIGEIEEARLSTLMPSR